LAPSRAPPSSGDDRNSAASVDENDPDRFINCQDALNDECQDLVERAVAAGWRPQEVPVAMIESPIIGLMMEANAEVEAALKMLKQKGFP
jgi:hypothetical protein